MHSNKFLTMGLFSSGFCNRKSAFSVLDFFLEKSFQGFSLLTPKSALVTALIVEMF